MTITRIVIHHFGSSKNDPYASTFHLTLSDIDEAHRVRWPDFKSSLGYWVGYNFIIFPTGTWTQTRAIGEETAAQKGFNLDSISICLAGNFNLKPDGQPIDKPTFLQQVTLRSLLSQILEGNLYKSLIQLSDTKISVNLDNIVPHRKLAMTDCNGNSLPDNWGKNIVREYINYKLSLWQKLLELYQKLISLGVKPKLGNIERHHCFEMDNRG